MNKFLALLTLPWLLAPTVHAESKPDPSDLTQVNSFLYGTFDSDNTFKASLGLAGQYSEGNSFMGLVEHGYQFKDKLNNSRLRYFQVFDTGSEAVSQAGLSVDYIKGWDAKSDIVALGTIAKVATPWQSLSIFPNLAYVTGKADGKTVTGYQTNIFASMSLGDEGDYLIFQPQWMDTNLGRKFEVKSGYGAPVSDDGKVWWDISHTYQNTKVGQAKASGDHQVALGLAYYF
ncbi:hypothetical protein [Motilimonas pumila]|uniref:Porin n=1 Tax=Motilimonas pumila TaxID=2303987 RepID=A0A418YE68_9GAMM|nr:hypothetical protein [Motilimonas pumila]RJG47433.1 hypothetical protein D1Z90_11005 [Motilimonas pumila]